MVARPGPGTPSCYRQTGKFLTFTATVTRTAPFRRIACLKGSTFFPIYNKIRTFFCNNPSLGACRGVPTVVFARALAKCRGVLQGWMFRYVEMFRLRALRPSAQHDSTAVTPSAAQRNRGVSTFRDTLPCSTQPAKDETFMCSPSPGVAADCRRKTPVSSRVERSGIEGSRRSN